MKTLIALSAALMLSFVAPAYAASPEPVSKSHRYKMIHKKKHHKKPGKKKKMSRRNSKGCGMVE